MLYDIDLQKCLPLRRNCHKNMRNISNASPEYLTSSTGESTNSNGYRNKVSHIKSLQNSTRVKLDAYTLYQQIGGDQDIPSYTLDWIMVDHVELFCALSTTG